MLRLIAPTTALHRQWLESRDDWGPGVPQNGAGLHADDDVDSPAGFAAWVGRLNRRSDPAVPPGPGFVRATYWWIVEDHAVLGAVSLRHELNDFLRNVGGHIGYGVRPAARRRGVATFALGGALRHAHSLGLGRVLLTCDVDNQASRRTIEGHGGVLEDIRDTELGRVRRYWIGL